MGPFSCPPFVVRALPLERKTPCYAVRKFSRAKRLAGTSTPSPSCGGWFIEAGYSEVILPAIWEADTFLGKIGPEKESQMWTFRDRSRVNACLAPEATAVIQEMWNNGWSATMPKPARLFYVARCYRFEEPQEGRYREFTQFGIEALGPSVVRDEVIALMKACLEELAIPYTFHDKVPRGLRYYIDAGFETSCAALGPARQLGGGGRYAEGIGWALGVERLMLAQDLKRVVPLTPRISCSASAPASRRPGSGGEERRVGSA